MTAASRAPLFAPLVLALLCSARLAQASPAHTLGFGARALALGGATSADSADGSAVFYNPSGLVLAAHSELSLGYSATAFALQISGEPASAPALHTLSGSLLGRGTVLSLPAAFGLALGLSNGHLSRARTVTSSEPRWVRSESSPELLNLGVDVALEPFSWLAVGGGVGFLAATRGGFDVTGTALLADGRGAEYDSQLQHAVDTNLVAVRYPTLGLTVRPFEQLALALAYRGPARVDQRITGTLSGRIDAGLASFPVRYAFESESVVAFQPREVVLGASVQLAHTHLNADLSWQEWSRYPSPVARSGAQLQATLPPGLDLTLPPSSDLPGAQNPHFHNRLSPRLGIEHTIRTSLRSAFLLRAGYAFEASPTPAHQSQTHFVDSDRHELSFGCGVWLEPSSAVLPSSLRLDTYALWAGYAERSLRSDALTGPATFSASGHLLSGGATLSLAFK